MIMRNRWHKTLPMAFAAIILTPCAARAAVIWDNGPFDTVVGFKISDFAFADDVSPGAPSSFNAVRFWVFDDFGDPTLLDAFSGTLSWFLYDNVDLGFNVNVPGGSVLASGTVSGGAIALTDTGVNLGGGFGALFQAGFNVPDTLLPAGRSWFRVKEGGVNSAFDGTNIFWINRDGQTGSPSRFSNDEVNPSWGGSAPDLAFQLIDNRSAVPEPASLLLLAVGALGLARSRWRKNRDKGRGCS